MKLLFITPGRLPVPAKKGGAVENLVELLLEYNEKNSNNRIQVISIYDQEAEAECRKYKNTYFKYLNMGQVYSYISNNHLLPYRLLNCFFAWKVFRCLKKESVDYDFIVIENEPINGCILKRFIKGTYIFHSHSSLDQKIGKQEKKFLLECEKIITVSDFLKRDIKMRTGADNVITVHNGIDSNIFCREKYMNDRSNLRRQFGFLEDDVVVVFSGRIVPEKGIEELLKAFLSLSDISNVKLLILGGSFFGDSKENAFIQNLRQLCEPRRDKIVFAGYIKHEEIPAYYCAADIGCVPSLCEEAFGLSVAEQMAMELPVIVTDAGALPEIVDESCGFVISKNACMSAQIAEAVKILSKDQNLRKEMGLAGRRIVCEKFEKKIYSKKWFEVIDTRGD